MVFTCPTYIFLSATLILSLCCLAYGRFRRRFIDRLPGPPSSSWLAGNIPDMFRSAEICDAPLEWTKKYGNVVRVHGEFNRKFLFISDPKAMQYVLNTSGYNYTKAPATRAKQSLMLGKGLLWAEGPQHARQRKIVTPAFSFNTLREFIPLFRYKAQQAAYKIKQEIESTNSASVYTGSESGAVIDVAPWLSRITLDIIGMASAAYDFGAIEGDGTNKLAKIYHNLAADAFYKRSDIDFVVIYLMGKLPPFVSYFLKRLKTKSLKKLKPYISDVNEIAQDIIDKQTALYVDGKEGSKDLMSVLIRANLSENPKTSLTNEEVLSQLTTFFFAGHQTTAFSLTWTLYELARHPEYQNKVREEIKTVRARVAAKGSEITISDLDSMQYLVALVKETLRFHPVSSAVLRQATKDDYIPLSNPIKLNNGEIVTSLAVERGQDLQLSFIAYNRLKSVWGDDADVWRPERFLEERDSKHQVGLGVLSNVATFSSGVKSCIGWRFSVLEMQAILIELLENFEFSPPPGNTEILQVFVGATGPMVKGSKSGRTELPLTVTPLVA